MSTEVQPAVTGNLPMTAVELCRNCGAALTGQYCATCGQRARVRIVSLWEFVTEAFGDLFELDSRLWRTLRPLVFRPGLLTREYLHGRRTYFLPPFRLYLVLSLLFFLLTGLQRTNTILFDANELDPTTRAQVEKEIAAVKGQLDEQASKPGSTTSTAASGEQHCNNVHFDVEFAGSKQLEPQLKAACRKIVADNGSTFGRALIANIPHMMFIFLPLLALVNKVLYVRQRRYYVEHLLFFVHFHAFVFLTFIAETAFASTLKALHGPTGPASLLVAVITIYIPIYLYKALRRVYEQGRAITLFKYFFLVVAYFACLLLMFLGTVFYTLLTM